MGVSSRGSINNKINDRLFTKVLNTTITITITMKCEKCGYEWESRKNDPKSCPRCKARLDWK